MLSAVFLCMGRSGDLGYDRQNPAPFFGDAWLKSSFDPFDLKT